jgi:hypothetical protein
MSEIPYTKRELDMHFSEIKGMISDVKTMSFDNADDDRVLDCCVAWNRVGELCMPAIKT